MKKKGESHINKEWDLDISSFDYDDEGLATIAFNKSSLFPKFNHTCLMAKEKKVYFKDTPKYRRMNSWGSKRNYSMMSMINLSI
jgi:hypothetical protein